MAITDASGIPIAVHTASASPNEVTLVEDALRQAIFSDAPRRIFSDGASDRYQLVRRLGENEIGMIAPN